MQIRHSIFSYLNLTVRHNNVRTDIIKMYDSKPLCICDKLIELNDIFL